MEPQLMYFLALAEVTSDKYLVKTLYLFCSPPDLKVGVIKNQETYIKQIDYK